MPGGARLVVVQVPSETGAVEQSEWVKPFAQMQRHWLLLTTLVPPFLHGLDFWHEETELTLEAALDLGITTRVMGMTTAAAISRSRIMIRRMKAHSGIPQQRRRGGGRSSEREEP